MNRSTLVWKLCVGAVGITAICLVVTSFYKSSHEPSLADSTSRMKRQQPVGGVAVNSMSMAAQTSSAQFWQGVDMNAQPIPDSVVEAAKSISVSQGTLQMPQGAEVFYQYSLPDPEHTAAQGQFVLLLHGAAFSSQNWVDIGTLPLLAAMGHTPVAIDIPGYGKSRGDPGHREDFVSSIVSLLEKAGRVGAGVAPVVVSPSMSGGYSIPALQAEAARAAAGEQPALAAYVPVAPVATNLLTEEQAHSLTIPTLILYGDRDTGLGKKSVKDLRRIPTSQVVEIKDAGHPAYINQPGAFHRLLYNFLGYITEKQASSG